MAKIRIGDYEIDFTARSIGVEKEPSEESELYFLNWVGILARSQGDLYDQKGYRDAASWYHEEAHRLYEYCKERGLYGRKGGEE